VTPTLRAAYAEPRRRYHTLAHIEDCLARLAAVTGLDARERQILEWAIWWHDAVYDPTRGDNEALSAELAARDLPALGADDAAIAEVVRLILLTKGHGVTPGDRLGALMVSIDLSILGADPGTYRAYAEAIRAEYAHVPEAAYRLGRARVLEYFAAEPLLFADPDFAARFDAQARRNLAAEIAALKAG
jgi:predicted metal-dependent HD superfamily phosphohydrolase